MSGSPCSSSRWTGQVISTTYAASQPSRTIFSSQRRKIDWPSTDGRDNSSISFWPAGRLAAHVWIAAPRPRCASTSPSRKAVTPSTPGLGKCYRLSNNPWISNYEASSAARLSRPCRIRSRRSTPAWTRGSYRGKRTPREGGGWNPWLFSKYPPVNILTSSGGTKSQWWLNATFSFSITVASDAGTS